jgi:hypothetical protein
MHAPSISIGNDGSQVVNVLQLRPLFGSRIHSLIVVLLVMELLGSEDTMDLVWNSGIWIVAVESSVLR